MMYYHTPNVEKYLTFVKEKRVVIVSLFIAIIVSLLTLHKPTLISSDNHFWIQDSVELKRTLAKEYPTAYIKPLKIDIGVFNEQTKERLFLLHKELSGNPHVNYVDSLFSASYIYNDGKYEDSSLVKSLNIKDLDAIKLKKLVSNFYQPYKKYVNSEFDTLIFYLYVDKDFSIADIKIPFTYQYDSIRDDLPLDSLVLMFVVISLFTILFFYLIFKNFISGFLAVIVTSFTTIITFSLIQIIASTHIIHISTALIIISIALIDYLYFYYRWHVSHYASLENNSDFLMMNKTINRNLMPAMWTTIITIIGFGTLIVVDSVIVKMLAVSAIGASTVAYLMNITLLPALLSYFSIKHQKTIFARIAYNFANAEMHYNKKFLKFFLGITTIILLFDSYKLFFSSQQIFSDSMHNKSISVKVAYPEVDFTLFEKVEDFEKKIKSEFNGVEDVNSIVSILRIINLAGNDSAINEESFLEALFFLELYDLDKKYITSDSINMTINVTEADSLKLINWIKEYKDLDLYFTDMETIVEGTKADSLSTLSFSLAGALIIIGVIMGRIFREKKMILVAFIVNAIPIVWFMFIIEILGVTLTLEMLIAMTITVSLGSDATVHFAYKYLRSRHNGRSQKKSLEIMFFYGAVPVAIGSTLLTILFYLLSQTDIYTLTQIGWYGIIMMFISILTDIFVLPVLLLEEDSFKR